MARSNCKFTSFPSPHAQNHVAELCRERTVIRVEKFSVTDAWLCSSLVDFGPIWGILVYLLLKHVLKDN